MRVRACARVGYTPLRGRVGSGREQQREEVGYCVRQRKEAGEYMRNDT